MPGDSVQGAGAAGKLHSEATFPQDHHCDGAAAFAHAAASALDGELHKRGCELTVLRATGQSEVVAAVAAAAVSVGADLVVVDASEAAGDEDAAAVARALKSQGSSACVEAVSDDCLLFPLETSKKALGRSSHAAE